MFTASPWYTSATLWGAGSVLAVLVVGVATILATYQASRTGRVLTYGLELDSRLPSASPHANFKVVYEDQPVRNPHILAIRLENLGRKDIRSDDFDQGKPIELDIGIQIKNVEASDSNPPQVAFKGSQIEIAPCLIRKKQPLSIVVLADGVKPNLTCRSPLVDVDVRHQRYNKRTSRPAFKKLLLGSAVYMGGSVLVATMGGGIANVKVPIGGLIGLTMLYIGSGIIGYGAAQVRAYLKR